MGRYEDMNLTSHEAKTLARLVSDTSNDVKPHYHASAMLDGVRMEVRTDSEQHLERTIAYWYNDSKENIDGSARKFGKGVTGLKVTTTYRAGPADKFNVSDIRREVAKYNV